MGVEADAQRVKAMLAHAARAAPSPLPGGSSQAKGSAGETVRPQRKAGKMTPAAWAEQAEATAARCATMDTLVEAIKAFNGCPLKDGATNTVVYDGIAGAPIMVIGEGPGRDEDLAGRPFVGRAGQLLDKMLASITISRTQNALITNVNYWRPPRNRNPEADELLVCAPFVKRMIELNQPKLIIAAGAVPAKALLGTSSGIMKLRGTRQALAVPDLGEVPLFPILHPAYLLRRPEEKARAWRDLLMIEASLETLA